MIECSCCILTKALQLKHYLSNVLNYLCKFSKAMSNSNIWCIRTYVSVLNLTRANVIFFVWQKLHLREYQILTNMQNLHLQKFHFSFSKLANLVYAKLTLAKLALAKLAPAKLAIAKLALAKLALAKLALAKLALAKLALAKLALAVLACKMSILTIYFFSQSVE